MMQFLVISGYIFRLIDADTSTKYSLSITSGLGWKWFRFFFLIAVLPHYFFLNFRSIWNVLRLSEYSSQGNSDSKVKFYETYLDFNWQQNTLSKIFFTLYTKKSFLKICSIKISFRMTCRKSRNAFCEQS